MAVRRVFRLIPSSPTSQTTIPTQSAGPAEADFRVRGACVDQDPDLFFPAAQAQIEVARAVCQRCTVRDVCLRQALAHGEEHGIWAGTTPAQRRRIAHADRVDTLPTAA